MRILWILALSTTLITQALPALAEDDSFGVGGHLCATFAKFRARSPTPNRSSLRGLKVL